MSNPIDEAWNDGRRYGRAEMAVRLVIGGVVITLIGLMALGVFAAI
jgi:hypothetical protein